MSEAKRILLVSSSGGVLLDLLALEPWWSRYNVVWAVVKAADTESALAHQRVHWIVDVSMKQPFNFLPSFVHARRILYSECPDLVVSAGSGTAISFFLTARLLGIPTFWLSTLNIITTPAISAKICSQLASRVLLQRQSMLDAHPDGFVIGELY